MNFTAIYAFVVAFLGPAAQSIKGHINATELSRALLTGLAAGGSVASVYAALGDALPAIVAPADQALAVGLFIVGGDILRRMGHGAELAPTILKFPGNRPAA